MVAPFPVKVIFPVPKSITRALELFELNTLQVNVLLLSDKVPNVKVNVPDIVWFAPNVRPSVELFNVATAQAEPAAVVQVPVPDAVSNTTVSVLLGAAIPGKPPEVKDQLVVELASQVPVPPTQKYVAI
jgi:hypothetical protein